MAVCVAVCCESAQPSRQPVLLCLIRAEGRKSGVVNLRSVTFPRTVPSERRVHNDKVELAVTHAADQVANLLSTSTASGVRGGLNDLYLLADALGLTAIYVNRVLRQLREKNLVTFREGHVVFHDLAGLRALAEFYGSYLDQNDEVGL